MIIEILSCLFSGFIIGIKAFIATLPLYNFLGDIKETIISELTGIPSVIISILFALPFIIKITKKFILDL